MPGDRRARCSALEVELHGPLHDHLRGTRAVVGLGRTALPQWTGNTCNCMQLLKWQLLLQLLTRALLFLAICNVEDEMRHRVVPHLLVLARGEVRKSLMDITRLPRAIAPVVRAIAAHRYREDLNSTC